MGGDMNDEQLIILHIRHLIDLITEQNKLMDLQNEILKHINEILVAVLIIIVIAFLLMLLKSCAF